MLHRDVNVRRRRGTGALQGGITSSYDVRMRPFVRRQEDTE
jgi:hypothetical protein